jgi:hypothetical protein
LVHDLLSPILILGEAIPLQVEVCVKPQGASLDRKSSEGPCWRLANLRRDMIDNINRRS